MHLLATEQSRVEAALFQELLEGTVILAVEIDPLDLGKRTLRPHEDSSVLGSRCTDASRHK